MHIFLHFNYVYIVRISVTVVSKVYIIPTYFLLLIHGLYYTREICVVLFSGLSRINLQTLRWLVFCVAMLLL